MSSFAWFAMQTIFGCLVLCCFFVVHFFYGWCVKDFFGETYLSNTINFDMHSLLSGVQYGQGFLDKPERDITSQHWLFGADIP